MSQLPTDPAANLARLLRCPSVTPAEAGALAVLEDMLLPLGFEVQRPVFRHDGTPDVENLRAKRGTGGRHLAFAGHTDVVPPGDLADWRHPPFSAQIEDGELYGRGAVDMKGAIACFVAALARLIEAERLPEGQVSLLVTGDEEGPAINGTEKLLDFAVTRGERFDACILGEPTNPEALGDAIKVGRRGSLSGLVAILGRQGHVAYPHLAANPTRALGPLLESLLGAPLDAGTPDFPATNLEVTAVDTSHSAVNLIPARVTLAFNVRFNDLWDVDRLKAEVVRRIEAALGPDAPTPASASSLSYEVSWREHPAQAFITRPGALTEALSDAVETVTGRRPATSTSGGTSDARFVKNHCPVVEFGLVGKTMHMANERVALADLETLTVIYEHFIARWFAADA